MSLIQKLLRTVGLTSAAAESGVDAVNAELAARNPDVAQSITDEAHLATVNEIGAKVALAAKAAMKETEETVGAKRHHETQKVAARKVKDQLTALKARAADGESGLDEEIAKTTQALEQLLDLVEQAKAEYEKEEAERVNAQAYLETLQESLKEAKKRYQQASYAVRDAANDMARAKAEQELAELKRSQQRDLAKLRTGKPDDSMANAMKERAAKIRAETAGVQAEMSAVDGAQAPKVNDIAAAALAEASGKPTSLEDRAAALL